MQPDMKKENVMGTIEGYLLGQALAPTPEYNSGPMWRKTALEWKAEAEKLSASLEKEHKRFLVERRERRDYMRGWAVRGQILREVVDSGRYTNEEWDAAAISVDQEHNDEYLEMRDNADRKIDQEAGF